MTPNAYFRIIDPKEGGSWFFGQPHDAHGAQLNAQDFTDARRIEAAAPLILPSQATGARRRLLAVVVRHAGGFASRRRFVRTSRSG
jgi:hypothetical protein